MRLLVLSDLHVEFAQFVPRAGLQYDIVILAGDIHSPGRRMFKWARRNSVFGPDIPIIFVPGNHEFYRATHEVELQQMRDVASKAGVHLLDLNELILADPKAPGSPGVRFLGATLWTDFRAPVMDGVAQRRTDIAKALEEANRRLNDFRLINVQRAPEEPARRQRRPLRAEDTLALHHTARDWLQRRLAEPFPGSTVVITHHAPCMGSMASRYAGDWLSPAFVSDLPAEFFSVPTLWVHGHTHTSFDYQVGRCRVVCNPRGYQLTNKAFENPLFEPDLVIEV